MAPPKQRWTSEEEASVRAGVAKYKVGKWRAILNDPQFSSTLCCRSNVDLKDKWRNMNVTAISSASREKGRASREKERTSRVKKIPSAPKKDHHALAISIKEKWHNMNATALAAASREGRTALKAISIVTSDINDKIVDDPSKKPKSSVKYLKFKEAPVKVDAELVRMATMTAEEAAAATRAVAEAAALIKEARKAVKEADAQAAQAFAEAAFLTLKNRNATNW